MVYSKKQVLCKEPQKLDIQNVKPDIESKKPDIQNKLIQFNKKVSKNTINNAICVFDNFKNTIFGRSMIEQVTGLKSSQASVLIKLLLEANIIEPVKGQGKGKYRFINN